MPLFLRPPRSPSVFSLVVTFFCAWVSAQTASQPLVSKSIPLVLSVGSEVFAFSDISNGQSFSRVNLFQNPPTVQNGSWPWAGGAENGVSRPHSLLLLSDIAVSDTTHVARVVSLFPTGKFSLSDSLTLPLPGGNTSALVNGTAFTALAVWRNTAILGFGRLGIATVPLTPDTSDSVLTGSTVTFSALPSPSGSSQGILTCSWNQACRVDTVTPPSGTLDSVVALAVDSSAPDSIWLLIATQSGLRRGLLGGQTFPYVSLPGASNTAVQNIYAQPDHALLWVFTGKDDSSFFFSGDHGQSFHTPPVVAGLFSPDSITGFVTPPQAISFGETTYVNFNLARPGLVAFNRDTILDTHVGSGLDGVLLDADDSLGIDEGSLTSLAIADTGNQSVLALGSTFNGIFYRRLDLPGKTFTDLNRLSVLQNSLNQVITYPTVFATTPTHIGYRLAKSGNVTITVFNYAMEKVRVIVKNAPRFGGIARSENQVEDQWDGKDASGRFVSVGTYYILVESDQGEHGFGKAVYVGARQ